MTIYSGFNKLKMAMFHSYVSLPEGKMGMGQTELDPVDQILFVVC
jgi:hypothetical protein